MSNETRLTPEIRETIEESLLAWRVDSAIACHKGQTTKEAMHKCFERSDAVLAWLEAQPAADLQAQHDDLREKLAEYSHGAWSGWMEYMFNQGTFLNNKWMTPTEGEQKKWLMPEWAVERWTRQMNTPYSALSESEKKSDRAEADKMLEILSQFKPTAQRAEAHGGVSARGFCWSAVRGADGKVWVETSLEQVDALTLIVGGEWDTSSRWWGIADPYDKKALEVLRQMLREIEEQAR